MPFRRRYDEPWPRQDSAKSFSPARSAAITNPNALLSAIEQRHLWAYFHKDWIIEIRNLLRPQLSDGYHVFVESVELFTKWSLVIRRSPDQRLLADLEILSPSNKGLGNRTDLKKYLSKRDSYLEAGISFLEIDALLFGERLFPDALQHLKTFERNAWTAYLNGDLRRFRGYGWSPEQPMPQGPWQIDGGQTALINLEAAAVAASSFNRWDSLANPR